MINPNNNFHKEKKMQSIYVGNLSWGMTSEKLQEVFEKVGAVSSSRVITDRETGRSKGFGFVEMSKEDADKAVTELNGQEVEGRTLKVNLAEDKKKSAGGSRPYNANSNSSSYERREYTPRKEYTPSYGEGDFETSKPRSKKNWGGGDRY